MHKPPYMNAFLIVLKYFMLSGLTQDKIQVLMSLQCIQSLQPWFAFALQMTVVSIESFFVVLACLCPVICVTALLVHM